MDNTNLFALDIGTRKIVGIVMQKTDTGYTVLDSEMVEHSTRAMMDGQIHDVEAVASTTAKIKTALEERLGIKLDSASVAAAGRALKTAFGSAAKERLQLNEITAEEVRALEIEAVQKAQYLLAQEEMDSRNNTYFCVGYSITSYYLEDQEIRSLIGQVGSKISVNVVATFLPRVVVDSLFSALKRAGLDILSLTLEPIAALSVAIPPEMRLLNLALVDIGAGTSDIAIVKDNNIFAYAMVPSGGDRLTEIIASEYLLDFNTAEKVKRLLGDQEEIELFDILGNKTVIAGEIIKKALQPTIKELTEKIAQNILCLNQKAPDAVICVGGGSLTPNLTGTLAEMLNLSGNRVGIRTPASFSNIKADVDYLLGPQGVTPLGIAYYSFTIPPLPFIKVSVNGREIALWNRGELTVASALLSSGIALSNIYGKPGMGKTLEINGYIKIIKGKIGTPPIIKVNNKDAGLETNLKDGDEISFTRGRDGEDAHIAVKDLIPEKKGFVYVNGEEIKLQPLVKVNGKTVDFDTDIEDRARVEFKQVNSVRNILELAGVSPTLLKGRTYTYNLNGQEMFLKWMPVRVTVNRQETELEHEVDFNSEVNYSFQHIQPHIKDILNVNENMYLNVRVNGENVLIKGRGITVQMNGLPAGLDDELADKANIIWNRDENTAILSDIFNFIEIKPPLSGRLIIRVDGTPAGYTTPIHNNSEIELTWE